MNERKAVNDLIEPLRDMIAASIDYQGEVTNNELLKAILILLKQIERKLDNLSVKVI